MDEQYRTGSGRFRHTEGLTSLQDLRDAGVVSLQLHLELGQLLVQFTQVTVHLGTEPTNTDSGIWTVLSGPVPGFLDLLLVPGCYYPLPERVTMVTASQNLKVLQNPPPVTAIWWWFYRTCTAQLCHGFHSPDHKSDWPAGPSHLHLLKLCNNPETTSGHTSL